MAVFALLRTLLVREDWNFKLCHHNHNNGLEADHQIDRAVSDQLKRGITALSIFAAWHVL